MMMPELQLDLVEEILCRVPATSLKRLQSTCKRWNRLFNSRRFIRNHFDKAPKQSMMLMLYDSTVSLMSINLRSFPPVEVTCKFSVRDLHPSLGRTRIRRVFQCDGLLLCVPYVHNDRLVVWNPYTGQTRLVSWNEEYTSVALGSYQAKKSSILYNRYKILGYNGEDDNRRFGICEINSNSWRTLDVTLDFQFVYIHQGASLKGKTYWIARDQKDLGALLISFDYTTEKFERLCLPRQCPSYKNLSLSVVREEKLAVLLQHHVTEKTEIWVTNKISERKAVSWSKVLTVDLKPRVVPWDGGSFLVDEDQKILVYCNVSRMIYIVGEDNTVSKTDLGESSALQFVFNYVPSLNKIEQSIGGKREYWRQMEKKLLGGKRK